MTPQRILFCTDFSENSAPARQLAVDYARAFSAQLLIVHAVDTSGLPGYVDWVGDQVDQIIRQTQESAEARLASLARECQESVTEVKAFCRIGSAPQEIVSLAADENADLIVLGTHGRTGVKHLVMGSIARSVLKTAHRPVLIVEAPSGKGESVYAGYEFPVP